MSIRLDRNGAARRALAAMLALLVVYSAPVSVSLAADPAGVLTLRGKIFDLETGQPRGGGTVHAVDSATKSVYSSARSAPDGSYRIAGLPHGYFDLAVQIDDKLYFSNRIINVESGTSAEVSLILGPLQPRATEWWSTDPNRRIPGFDQVADGVAWVVEGIPRRIEPGTVPTANGGGRKPWLIPVLVGGGVLVLTGFGGGSSSDPVASPSN